MSMFNDLINGIGKEFEKVQTKSQEIMQSYNLSTQIKDLERKRNVKLLEIGRLVCDKFNKNVEVSDDTLKDHANEVAGYEHEISLLQTEIDQAKAANDPSTPRSSRADAHAGYNPTAGFECPRCQAPASKDQKFCPLCGASLKKADDDIVDVEPNGK